MSAALPPATRPRRPPDSAFALASPTGETGRGERGERGGRRCRCCRRCGGDSRRCCCCCRRGRRRCRRGSSSPFLAITRTFPSLGIIWRGRFGATLTFRTAGTGRTSPPVRRRDPFPACRSTRGVRRRKAHSKLHPTCLSGGAEASSVGPASVLPPSAGDGGNENAIRYTWRTGFFSSDDPRGASRALGAPPSRARAGQCSRELRNRRGRVDSRAGARRRLVASSSPRPDAKIWARGRALPAR